MIYRPDIYHSHSSTIEITGSGIKPSGNDSTHLKDYHSVMHRVNTIINARLSDFAKSQSILFETWLNRELSFIFSCLLWHMNESNCKFFLINNQTHTLDSVIREFAQLCETCKQHCLNSHLTHDKESKRKDFVTHRNNHKRHSMKYATLDHFADNHFISCLKQFAVSIQIHESIPIPHPVAYKIYNTIISCCNDVTAAETNQSDILNELNLLSDDTDSHDSNRTSPSVVPKLHQNWTEIINLLFILRSKPPFNVVSLRYHGFRFLDTCFKIIDYRNNEKFRALHNAKSTQVHNSGQADNMEQIADANVEYNPLLELSDIQDDSDYAYFNTKVNRFFFV